MADTNTPAEAANAGTNEQNSAPTPYMGQDPNPVNALIDRFRAKYGDDPGKTAASNDSAAQEAAGETPAENAGETPADKADASKVEPEAAAEKPKEPEEKTTTAAQDLQHARALRELAIAKGEALTHKQRADAAETWRADTLKRFKEGNPLEALEELRGQPLAEIMAAAAQGKFDKNEVKLPKEAQEALEYVKQRRQREEQEAIAAKRVADIRADVPKVKQFLEAKASEYPLLFSFDTAPEDLVEEVYARMDKAKGQMPDIRAVAEELEQEAAANFAEFFTNKKLIKHLSASNPQVRAALTETLEALGFTQQKPAGPASGTQGDPKQRQAAASRDEAPRTVATDTEIPTRVDREPTEAELRAESIRLFQQGRAAGRFQ